jgi:hypothetical protein
MPPSVFDKQSDSYEEYIDLDSLSSGFSDRAYRVVNEGKTVIDRTDLPKFLDIFQATLGFFRLTIYEALLFCVYCKRIRA